MRHRILYCLLTALVLLTSCARRERVIPRGKMAKIYAEMFIADQRLLNQSAHIRLIADTTFVYEPIFAKYGYTSDDYRASLAYYIQDANRFARILRQTSSIIDGELKDLKKRKAMLELLESEENMEDLFVPERIYNLTGLNNRFTFGADTLRFYVDSAGGERWFDLRTWMDTAYYGPRMVIAGDTLFVADTLAEEILAEEVATEDAAKADTDAAEAGTGGTAPAGKGRAVRTVQSGAKADTTASAGKGRAVKTVQTSVRNDAKADTVAVKATPVRGKKDTK